MRISISSLVARRPVAFAPSSAVLMVAVVAALGAPALARRIAVIPPDGIVSGAARIVDGDTIDIAGTRIRLEGIDAPEAGQTCQTARGETWECGTEATRVLVGLTQGRRVDCRSGGLDKYGRLLATCFVDQLDINAEMVRRGLAWAFVRYSRVYVKDEAAARTALAGIWQGPAMPAWEYRAQAWAAVEPLSPAGCAIKGNVSRGGLIYHMPWSPWYQKVTMRDDKGTRWFCSEAEAKAAGWRPAMGR
jgi:endonuclease YncB( thermonuclease family)